MSRVYLLLQCAAVCSSVVKCGAVCSGVVQHVAVCCIMLHALQYVAACCSVLQCVAEECVEWLLVRRIYLMLQYVSVSQRDALCCSSVLQCVAVCCSVLQCVAVCSSVFQCSALQCVAGGILLISHVHQFNIDMHDCDAVCRSSVLHCVAVCCSVLQ